ncbi:MAG TPA: cupin domain-containing protein [Mycobacterium sp.]|nr:cupin domain-containing protein [Mycobacterium sp.]
MLLADADTTDGAFNANRTIIAPGSAGPPPHFHTSSAEIFFVLGGSLRALAGDRVITLDEGDFLMVPSNMPHAFATPDGVGADLLILFTPAIAERFEYFRLGERVLKGQAVPQEILMSQDRFDNHFIDSPHWPSAGGPAPRSAEMAGLSDTRSLPATPASGPATSSGQWPRRAGPARRTPPGR